MRLNTRQGFTLVELMVALGLSSIVVGAAFALFINTNRVYQSTGQTSRLQQEARAALDIMAFEMQSAGFGSINPSLLDSTYAATAEDEVTFTQTTANSASGPDVIQFKASLGGMAIMSDPLSSGTALGTSLALLPSQGIDLLRTGMTVDLFNQDRERIGRAQLGSVSTTTPNIIRFAKFLEVPSETVETGAFIIQRPLYYTYMLSGDRLIRCARAARGECDPTQFVNIMPSDANPDPETTYVLAANVIDLQFSYLLEGTDVFDPAPNLSDLNVRRAIRAVKIDLLVRSASVNPTISQENCLSGFMTLNYYLADHTVSVGTDACRYSYAQVSTVVRLPNQYPMALKG